MEWGKIFLSIIIYLFESSFAENKQAEPSENYEKGIRNPRISSEFGYNIQNSDRLSNQFRQEQRDVNGVVRGSYGFKNPDGAFRLVHYVADDRGFRAHISSNEDGIGKQNPASISINRFEHQPQVTEDKTDFKPPISYLRKQNAINDALRSEEQLTRHNFYLPIQGNLRTTLNQNSDLPFIEGRDAYRPDTVRETLPPSFRQNPVDQLVRTRFGIPGEIRSRLRETERDDVYRNSASWESSPYAKVPSQHPLAQDYNTNIFSNPLSDSVVSLKNNHQDVRLQTRENSFHKSTGNYPPFLANLLHSPQHKVHTSLPDCKSVSSAMLCQPPSFFSQGISQQHESDDDELIFDEVLRTPASPSFLPKERTFHVPTSSNLYDLSNQENRMSPPHFIPKSYPLRSDIYNDFYNYMHEQAELERKHKDCQKHKFSGETSSRDYLTPSGSNKYTKDTTTNDLTQHNSKPQNTQFPENSEKKSSIEYSNENEEFYSSLMRVIQNDESLNKLKNMLFKPTQSSVDSTSEADAPKLSLLGVLILPSHIVKELDRSHLGKPGVKKVPETVDEKNLSTFDDDIFESDIIDESQHIEDNNRNQPETHFQTDSEIKGNTTFKDADHLENKTVNFGPELQSLPSLKNNPLETSDYNTSETETAIETMKNSKFHIFDDQGLFEKDSDKHMQNSTSSTENWRKILEDEISKELKLSSGEIPEELTHTEDNIQSNIHRYDMNKHIGPLYDSTGRLIEPENVPIHIHRFNPPISRTSVPWKYSIPRPAPPRSIVVPPKPSIIS